MDRLSTLIQETNTVLQLQRTVKQLMEISRLRLPVNLSP